MASLLESGWLYLITHFSDFQLSCLGSFFLHESVFFLSGLPFIYLERAGYLKKYKIQSKNNTSAAQEKCIARLLLYHFCVNLPVMIFSYPVFRYMGMQSSLPLPSWNVVLVQILFYFILEDFVFYWGHRILHTKWLYKHIHSVHHEYATPFGLTSEYAHPAEILFLGFATIIGPAITGPHLFTLWLWMVLRVFETVEAHCGYHFPWSISNFIPLYGGADFHDYHHRLLYTKSGNYSSTFTYMDCTYKENCTCMSLNADGSLFDPNALPLDSVVDEPAVVVGGDLLGATAEDGGSAYADGGEHKGVEGGDLGLEEERRMEDESEVGGGHQKLVLDGTESAVDLSVEVISTEMTDDIPASVVPQQPVSVDDDNSRVLAAVTVTPYSELPESSRLVGSSQDDVLDAGLKLDAPRVPLADEELDGFVSSAAKALGADKDIRHRYGLP